MAKRPSLDIALGSPDIEAFKSKMSEASNHVGTVARQMAKRFLDMNDDLKAGLLASASTMALGMVGRIALVVGSFKLMSDAIGATREQLKEMVAIADKSQNLGLSPAFFQSWMTESQKLKLEVGDLEGALSNAFNATKEKSPVDVAKWETGKEEINGVEKALRVYNATVAKAAGVQLDGLVMFRDADTQEKKILAVLAAMVQLESIGQKAAALDLGEKMFGSQFVDRIRQGKTSAESMLSSMNAAAAASDFIFSNDLVVRAKAVDEQLQLAEGRLTRSLKPTFEDLAGTILTIKGYWSDIVDLIGKAVEVTNRLGITSETARKKDELAAVNTAIKNGTGIWGVPQVPEAVTGALGMISPQERLRQRRDRLQGEIESAERQPNTFPELPKASRGTGAAPTLKPTGDTGPDKLETATDGIAKRTAALQAEAAAIDLGTEARERAKVTAQLETIAKQANAAAGKGENLVTDEQRQKIDEVAAAYSNAAQAMSKAKVASSIKFDGQTAMLDPSDVAIAHQLRDIYPNVAAALGSVEAAAMRANEAMKGIAGTMSSTMTAGLTDILDGTKSVSAGFADMGKVILRALEEAMIKALIVGPIMRSLGGGFGFSTGGLVGDFIGPVLGHAAGGMISGPGTGTSDTIPARLSAGEFVVKASETAKHRALLEAINGGRIPKFADGGVVAAPEAGSAPIVGGQTTIAPTINVTVAGSAGASPKDHAAMGAAIAKSAEQSMRAMIISELRTQIRPGGILR
ncbi:hypothetical protein FNL56_16620 [Tardiphaga sp. vice304]|uniref:hypothetical protein n=1 Tax=Tardiphaga sp. vice304 TaxID=2592817 RepID=UPI001164AEB9|nr:hypothetical protein [Tardiphaga sp. vice304]QDM27563.1 hypothetical protein FNL56_16620 [Tardiphaga sp. vice304]